MLVLMFLCRMLTVRFWNIRLENCGAVFLFTNMLINSILKVDYLKAVCGTDMIEC